MDAIYAECFSRWGGRFSLIVPSDETGPDAGFEDWLEAYDPDIIYSYVELNDATVERLHAKLYPSFLVKHRSFGQDGSRQSFTPRLPVAGLSSLTTLAQLAVPSPFNRLGRPLLLDAFGRADSDLLSRSFGFYSRTYGRSFAAPHTELAAGLVFASTDTIRDRRRYFVEDATLVESALEVLDLMASGRGTTVSQLSSRNCTRLEVRSMEPAFYVVVGDSFTDRILFWNLQSLQPTWRDGDSLALSVPAVSANDPATVSAIGKFIGNRNFGYSGGQPRVVVCSSSVGPEVLGPFSNALNEVAQHQIFAVRSGLTLADCRPGARELARASEITAGTHFAETVRQGTEDESNADMVEVTPETPAHLRYCPAWMLSPGQGKWAVDCTVSGYADGVDSGAREPTTWSAPRRVRFARLFFQYPEHEPRVSRGGNVSTFFEVGQKPLQMRNPNVQDALLYGLVQGRDWSDFEGGIRARPPQPMAEIRVSDSGRNFRGVLALFGGARDADRVLRHVYWQSVFSDMGGSPMAVERRRDKVKEELARRLADLPDGHTPTTNELAQMIVREAERFRSDGPPTDWDQLLRGFRTLQSKSWKNNGNEHLTQADEAIYKKEELTSFKRQVQYLCERGVLYQGYEIRCSNCHHRTWISIGALGKVVECEVCGTESPAPVDQPWKFRLNDFLRDSLRKRGILPSIWALHRLRPRFGDSFDFVGPVDLYPDAYADAGGTLLTDIDLTCFASGQVIMCEVKQSVFNLSDDQIDRFSEAMRRIMPNVAALAVMEDHSPEVQAFFERLARNLTGVPVTPKLITLNAERDLLTDVMDIGN